MEQSIRMIEEALAISLEEIKAIENKDIYMADELLTKRENIMRLLGKIAVEDKLLFYKKLQELQGRQVLIIDMSQKLRREYVDLLQRSGKEGVRLSAYKKTVGQALAVIL